MLSFAEAVDRLTIPWTDVLTPAESPSGRYEPLQREPLLVLLQRAIVPSGEGGGGGRSQDRVPLSTEALQVWQSIDERSRAGGLQVGHLVAGRALAERVRDFADHAAVAWRTGQVSESDWAHLSEEPAKWVQQIEDLLDPPRTKELKPRCPRCGELWVSDPRERETRHHCLLLHFRDGGPEAWAECRRCSQTWVGVDQLKELGALIGARPDVGLLREMGVSDSVAGLHGQG